MWSTIIPELMTITVWVLTFLCIRAGTEPGYLQGYAVMSINATGLKQYEPSPLYDVYNIYMSTVCAGYYVNASPSSPLTNFTCTASSSYSEFNPRNKSITNLPLNEPGNFPLVIQDKFLDYNLQLHVAWVFYVLSIVWTGLAMLFGITALFKGSIGVFIRLFTSFASTCLFISSVIVSVVQQSGVEFINDTGNGEISASATGGLLALTWSAFALSSLSSLVWLGAGYVSAAFRNPYKVKTVPSKEDWREEPIQILSVPSQPSKQNFGGAFLDFDRSVATKGESGGAAFLDFGRPIPTIKEGFEGTTTSLDIPDLRSNDTAFYAPPKLSKHGASYPAIPKDAPSPTNLPNESFSDEPCLKGSAGVYGLADSDIFVVSEANTAQDARSPRFLTSNDQMKVECDGFISQLSIAMFDRIITRACPFTTSPVAFVRMVMALRRKGQSFKNSHFAIIANADRLLSCRDVAAMFARPMVTQQLQEDAHSGGKWKVTPTAACVINWTPNI
ncbi:hypothetical protein VE03_10187 [Pseudogymnoascus sp. 23342-1-I1]|nr:hypothetical protein VE03_10187 [Pseudogymnoascus sp. 23342-1-I1]